MKVKNIIFFELLLFIAISLTFKTTFIGINCKTGAFIPLEYRILDEMINSTKEKEATIQAKIMNIIKGNEQIISITKVREKLNTMFYF